MKKGTRSYSQRTLKILFTLSGNQCAHPECSNRLIVNETEHSPDHVVGQISHIYAHSEAGPRGNPGLTPDELNGPDNLLIFCPTHHSIVDGQEETFPADLLTSWKRQHESRYRNRVSAGLKDIGYAELEVCCRALVAANASTPENLQTIPPADKIKKNKLGDTATMLITMGAAMSHEVEFFLRQVAMTDPAFPDRLRAGFVSKYQELKATGMNGDSIFMALSEWAGAENDRRRDLAGQCVLAHLFVLCDVFEK